jgi:diacylglycerol kinase (ATP)
MTYAKKMSWRTDADRVEAAVKGIHKATTTERAIKLLLWGWLVLIVVLGIFAPQRELLKQSLLLVWICVVAEMLNTSLEGLCDILQPQKDCRIKKIKDMSSWAVFLFTAIAVGITAVDLYFAIW